MKNTIFFPVMFPAVLCAVLQISTPARGQIVNLTDNNSIAQVSLGSQAGMYGWYVDNVNQLHQQWFWYALGNNAPASIDTIGPAVVTTSGTSSLQSTYFGAGFNVGVKYTLTGGSFGSGVSDMAETITINNTTATPLLYHFYQYSDFNLRGIFVFNDSVDLSKAHGLFNDAYQTQVGLALTETVAAPGAQHGEAELLGVTIAKLNNGVNPVTLSDHPSAGPGDVTFAFEWDLTIVPYGTAIISKDKYLQVVLVPEPSTLALVSLGLLAGTILRRRRLF
jgi:hypothetical protein